jgi:hypothetical protein
MAIKTMVIKAELHGIIFALLGLCSLSAPAIAQEAAITTDGSNFTLNGGNRGGENLIENSVENSFLREEKTPVSSNEVIPARGMMVNAQGQIVLTGYSTPNASERTPTQTNYCAIEVPSLR